METKNCFWKRDIQEMHSIEIDSSGNVYLAINASIESPNNDAYLLKYNSSGVIQWQRSFSFGDEDFGHVSLDTSGNPRMAFWSGAGTKQAFVLSYPASGSKTGTYTIGSQNVTVAAGTLTDSDWGATSSSSISVVSNNPGTSANSTFDVSSSTAITTTTGSY